ncbi:MAG: AI-2E family transporter [Muribaculaceae bacterium]|nr:AI-2E family transporter [Muribaculaceae bacterium]
MTDHPHRQETVVPSRPFTFDRVVRLLITVAAIAAVLWLIGVLKSVLLPFLVAWLIAYLLEPFVQYNRRLLGVRKRWLPITMTLFECVLVLSAVSVFVVPSIISEMHQVADFIRHYSEKGSDIPFVPSSLHEFLRNNIDFERISRSLTRQDIQTIFDTVGSFISGGYDIVMGIFNWLIVLLYVVFIML